MEHYPPLNKEYECPAPTGIDECQARTGYIVEYHRGPASESKPMETKERNKIPVKKAQPANAGQKRSEQVWRGETSLVLVKATGASGLMMPVVVPSGRSSS